MLNKNIMNGKNEICMIARLILNRRSEKKIKQIIKNYSSNPKFIERTLKHMLWAILKCDDTIRCKELYYNIEYISAFLCSCLIISSEEIISKEYYNHD